MNGAKLERENRTGEDRLVELITHLAGCSTDEARVALEAAGPMTEGLGAVAKALTLLGKRLS